jgi:hypothetical protein
LPGAVPPSAGTGHGSSATMPAIRSSVRPHYAEFRCREDFARNFGALAVISNLASAQDAWMRGSISRLIVLLSIAVC